MRNYIISLIKVVESVIEQIFEEIFASFESQNGNNKEKKRRKIIAIVFLKQCFQLLYLGLNKDYMMQKQKHSNLLFFSQQIHTNCLILPERECQTIETIHVNVMYQQLSPLWLNR